MKKALVLETRVCEVLDQVFPVAPTLVWLDCADDVTPETHVYDGVAFVLKKPSTAQTIIDFSDLNNIDKIAKSLALLTRQYANALKSGAYAGSAADGSKTVADLRADFGAIYRALP